MPVLYVATNGLSVWSSTDLGATIGRMPSSSGLYSGSQVWSLVVHPVQPRRLFAGTDSGVYRLDQELEQWTHLPSPMDDAALVTALAIDPSHPDTILAGTQPAGLYRSEDAGQTWTRLAADVKPYVSTGFYAGDTATAATAVEPAPVKHWTRVTQIVFDPLDPQIVLAGVEIDGAWRSADGGRTFTRVTAGLVTEDIHGFGYIDGATAEPRLFATTNAGLHASADGGRSWNVVRIDSPWQYTRSIVQRTDRDGVVFLTNGNGPPGSDGRLFRSRDRGAHWDQVTLPVTLESSLYFMAVNRADPTLVFAATNLGQLLRSVDGGETWSALPRRLPEVRAMAWLPDEHNALAVY